MEMEITSQDGTAFELNGSGAQKECYYGDPSGIIISLRNPRGFAVLGHVTLDGQDLKTGRRPDSTYVVLQGDDTLVLGMCKPIVLRGSTHTIEVTLYGVRTGGFVDFNLGSHQTGTLVPWDTRRSMPQRLERHAIILHPGDAPMTDNMETAMDDEPELVLT